MCVRPHYTQIQSLLHNQIFREKRYLTIKYAIQWRQEIEEKCKTRHHFVTLQMWTLAVLYENRHNNRFFKRASRAGLLPVYVQFQLNAVRFYINFLPVDERRSSLTVAVVVREAALNTDSK